MRTPPRPKPYTGLHWHWREGLFTLPSEIQTELLCSASHGPWFNLALIVRVRVGVVVFAPDVLQGVDHDEVRVGVLSKEIFNLLG